MTDSQKTGNQEFGDLLREAREDRGMSRRDLAEATNLSYPYISQLETGYRMPSPAAIQTLSRVLGVSLDAIFAAITTAPPPQPAPPRPSARATSAGWVDNRAYHPIQGRGGSAGVSAAGGSVAGSAAGGSAATDTDKTAPDAAGTAAPILRSPAPLTQAAQAPAGPEPSDASDEVHAAVDILLRLPADRRLDAVAQVQAQVVDSVVREGVRRSRHP